MVETFARDSLELGRSSRQGSCIFGIWGYLSVWGDVGRDRGLFGWVWWRSVGILIFLPGIPLFLAVALIRDRVFWVIWGHLRVWSRMG